jgi:protein O-GlcNAc transferase
MRFPDAGNYNSSPRVAESIRRQRQPKNVNLPADDANSDDRPRMLSPQRAIEIGLEHHRAGRFAQAEAVYRQILDEHPDHPGALELLGLLAYQNNDLAAAEDSLGRAISAGSTSDTAHGSLAVIQHMLGKNELALQSFARALQLNPNNAATHNNLANVHAAMGNSAEAIASYERAVSLKQDYFDALTNVGLVLMRVGRGDDARAALERAVEANPNHAPAHNALAQVIGQSDPQRAIASFRRAMELNPQWADPASNLGGFLSQLGQESAAVDAHRQALARDPNSPAAHNNLGIALMAHGEVSEAIAAFRRAIGIDPAYVTAHDNLLWALHYDPAAEPRAIFDEHVRWAQQHAEPFAEIRPHEREDNDDRPLRIGYVSADLHEHPIAYFIEPVLRSHDRTRFEIFCYNDSPRTDVVHQRLRAIGNTWRDVAFHSDHHLVDQIRADGIDILVDLAGHTARNRLLAFARKPAPVQITWLGYPNTTGMRTIDYWLSDDHLNPTGQTSNALATEQILRLPDTFACYQPPADAPQVNKLPAESNGGEITFASFNYLAKLNDSVLELWSKLLRDVPRSRLIIAAPYLNDEAVLDALADRFAARGVDIDRLELLQHRQMSDYLALYHQADILLDPFPFTGHTTTLHALWMGVPPLSLAGNTHVSRRPVSILSNLKLTELLAHTPEEFLKIGRELCDDVDRLADLRATMRQRMQASPLLDAGTFTANLESAFRDVWSRRPASTV